MTFDIILGLIITSAWLLVPILIVAKIFGKETAESTTALGFIPWTLFGLWLAQLGGFNYELYIIIWRLDEDGDYFEQAFKNQKSASLAINTWRKTAGDFINQQNV